ncbi:MAG: helix-turn-helix transcriptional regulator [Bacteroidetes bacterium]|nr:helix-turn-helix transcriptional regulator [Bacteroidota bacterium]
MEADIHTLYESDFYRVLDFKCRCTDCRTSKPEYGESFCISFVRKGNFLFNVFRHSLDSYNGCILVTKPYYERTVTHAHAVPDECTIFDFKLSFYNELMEQYGGVKFLFDNDLHSTLLKTKPEIEFLHFLILRSIISKSDKLNIDNLVIEVVETVLNNLTDYKPDYRINSRLKKNHLITIEKAKEYLTQNYTNDISLMELASYCCASPFHFSRIFKTFTSYSPHQFLLNIRLKNSELLLRNTTLPIADIAFSSGFNSIEHFTLAFRNKYNSPPAKFRSAKVLS